MIGLRDFFKSSGGKVVAVLLLIAASFAVWHSVKNSFGTDDATAMSNDPVFVDSKGHHWHQKVYPGMAPPPVKSPVTGELDGYPAEMCWWTKEGTARSEGFPVYLNSNNSNNREPTFCPDCGRLVHYHNPLPQDGGLPPPTKEEYEAKHKSKDSSSP